jgi:hypothetical protein
MVCAAGWYLAATDLPRLPAAQPAPAPDVAHRELAPRPRLAEEPAPRPPELAPAPRLVGTVIPPPPAEKFAVVRVDQPAGVYKLDALGANTKLKLVGRANRLTIDDVTAGAVLDTTELVAKHITIQGSISGRATVRLKCDGGIVQFLGGISGGSTVAVDNPGGNVMFSRRKGQDTDIEGGARLTVTSRTAAFTAPARGPDTRIDLTLTARGSLRFTELADGAKLLYRLAHPDDPPPMIHPGQIRDTAECKREE